MEILTVNGVRFNATRKKNREVGFSPIFVSDDYRNISLPNDIFIWIEKDDSFMVEYLPF